MCSYTINILKNKEIIGCAMGEGDFSTIEELDHIASLINAYNKHLIGKNEPDAIIAHRFLEQENIEYSVWNWNCKMFPDSYQYAIENYPDYVWPSQDEADYAFGTIALTKEDIKDCNLESKRLAEIDLDKNMIYLHNFFTVKAKEDYAKDRGITLKELLDEYDFATLDYDITRIFFNQLEEIDDFLADNKDGFCIYSSDSIYIPVNES